MNPSDLGFVFDETNAYWRLLGDSGFEVALEPYGANEYLLAIYQNKRLLTLKYRAWMHGKMLLVAGLPLKDEHEKDI